MTDPDFTTVEGRVEVIRTDAVQFARPLEAPCWIPRSLIHYIDRGRLDATMVGEAARLRIRTWKVKELRWDATGNTGTGDLFDAGRPIA